MRILYLSCHSINEYEDIKLFTELGHEVLSQGAYKNPDNPEEKARPPIHGAYHNEELRPLLHLPWGTPIPQPLIDWCDMVYILAIESWLPTNWERIKHKTVVFRSTGQSNPHTEAILAKYKREGLKIVRYSPFEKRIPGYCGEDAIIRFYKDPDEYKGWIGGKAQVITIAQAMKKREPFLRFNIFEKATRGFPRTLYGYNNDDVPFWGGALTYEQLKQVLRENRVFVYTGTAPAPYTMAFQEALMCFPYETEVAAWGIKEKYSRTFSGSMIEIETERGFKCTATPNHPFFTSKGWVMAKDLDTTTGILLYVVSDGWNKDLDSRAIGDIVEVSCRDDNRTTEQDMRSYKSCSRCKIKGANKKFTLFEPERIEKIKYRYAQNIKVYNLGTSSGVYIANNFLVHNCGIPIVSIGQELAGFNTFEVPYLIENGINGFVSDSLLELRKYISVLLENYDMAKRISQEGRKLAIELFDKNTIKEQWREFFEGFC